MMPTFPRTSPAPGRTDPSQPRWLGLPRILWLIMGIYVAMTLSMALTARFPSRIDELQHFSVIRAQFEQPTLFPDWSRYRILREDELSRWSVTPNYINHPALYYLLLAPLMAVTTDPVAFRLVNLLLSAGALLIVVVAAHRRFPADVVPPALFACLAASFPKAAVVGGMINNDNLAALAAAALFAGIAGLPGAGWWIMAALAIAGWTKLTALLALAAVAGAWLALQRPWRNGAGTAGLLPFAAAGLALGAVPYFVTFLRTDHILWVNEVAWRVPIDRRAHLDLAGYAAHFLDSLVRKWPAAEAIYAFPLALIGLLTPLLLAAMGLREKPVRALGLAYMAGLAFLFAVHFAFGWRSFQTLGDLTIMQARYYAVLWPGIALAATAATARLARRWRPAPWIVGAVCLSPTLVGASIWGLSRLAVTG